MMKTKRLTGVALLLSLLLSCTAMAAQAEIRCICDRDACICFIQEGDEGPAVEVIQHALIAQGYLSPKEDGTVFDARTTRAVKAFQRAHNLPETGMMDDATLTLLLWGKLPEELGADVVIGCIDPVWIPTDGGIRHHKKNTCSKMQDPRLVSHRNAVIMGMRHCGRCAGSCEDESLSYFGQKE